MKNKGKKTSHENSLPGQIPQKQIKENAKALEQAGKDMDNDAELSAHNNNYDLDEGETARLSEEDNDLV